jgi:hypothetical protein
MKEKNSSILTVCYPMNVTRERIENDKYLEIIDDLLPTVSGRDYKVMKKTEEATYQDFLFRVEQRNLIPISIKTFRKLLSGFKIHHSSKSTGCPVCVLNNCLWEISNEEKELLTNHLSQTEKQITSYLEMKDSLKPGEVIVVQDFTKIDISSSSRQCFCICIYSKEEEKIKRRYLTFLGATQKVKNDIRFVVSSWLRLISQEFFQSFENIQIWSDGGPKHFKITAALIFFCVLQLETKKKFTYNFFTSYHGHSVCDAMASHIKKKLIKETLNYDLYIDSSEELISIMNQIEGYENKIIDIDEEKQTCGTLKGIRKYHKFQFKKKRRYSVITLRKTMLL